MYRLICLIIGYGIGCIQTAYIVGRMIGKIDIREHGSGNAGTTNMIRVLGLKIGLLVFVCDILKGMVAFLLCSLFFQGGGAYFTGAMGLLPGMYGGLGAILGHNFPAQLKFRGGKGIAASVGVVFWLDWRVALSCYLTAIVAIAITRYVSLGSLMLIGLLPILLAVFGYPPETIGLGLLLAALAFYQHRGNVERLFKGCERKFNFKKEGKEGERK